MPDLSPWDGLDHQITVGRLRELLNLLQEGDVLVPNAVRNLAVVRGSTYIGFIDLLDGHQSVEVEEPTRT